MINEYVDDESDNESDVKVEDLEDSTNHFHDTLASSFQQVFTLNLHKNRSC